MKTAEIYTKPGGTGCYRSEAEAHADADTLNDALPKGDTRWKAYNTIPGVIWTIARFPQFRNRVDK